MQISQFFLNGDIKGAIAYMRNHGEYRDVLPAYVAIFENCDNILLLQFPAASNSGGDMIRLFYISRIIHWIPNFTLRVHIKAVKEQCQNDQSDKAQYDSNQYQFLPSHSIFFHRSILFFLFTIIASA